MLWTVAKAKVYGAKWRRGESLGEGAQGHAYYATRLSDDSKGWVIKVMRGSVSAGRFEQEIRALAGPNSRRIPRVEDYSVEGEDRYYVVRYLGLPLDEFHRARETPMEERLRIFQQIVEAVRDAHSVDVAHRNIKPNNVVVDEARDVSLLDFGICHVVGEEIVHLSSQEKYGNEAFAVPECLQGSAEECSFPADIYSLGKLLFWLVSDGGYIHRENVREAVPERIEHPNPLCPAADRHPRPCRRSGGVASAPLGRRVLRPSDGGGGDGRRHPGKGEEG